MERRILSWGRPPKFIQHSTCPMPMSRMFSMCLATVSGDPKATVSADEAFPGDLGEALGGGPEARLEARVCVLDALGHLEAAQRILVPHLGVLGLGEAPARRSPPRRSAATRPSSS
jgi:hypothetical protein